MGSFVRSCCLIALCSAACSSAAWAQVLSNTSLSGKYFARHVQFTTSSSNAVTDSRSILGVMTFDGAGHFSFTGQQTIGTAAAATYSVSGTYSVGAGGIVTLTNPQTSGVNLNARFGVE